MRTITPPALPSSQAELLADITDILKNGVPSPVNEKNNYVHWDTLRYRKPPDGLTAEGYWKQIKLARLMGLRVLPFSDKNGNPFWFCQFEQLEKFQHWLDKKAAGQLGAQTPETFNQKQRQHFLINGLANEAIYSSQLEGASTTRNVARSILAKRNPHPANADERMIINNYQAMQFIEQHKHSELSIPMILELHKTLTKGTLDNKADEGMLRKSSDTIVVYDNMDGKTMHTPPPSKDLLERLQLLCDFANEKELKNSSPEHPIVNAFLHPAQRAIILHFMLAYEHPFVDGNGRTARVLFYWAMARYGYWLVPYVSISGIIKQAPRKYERAFVYTETDGNDMTYFLLHQTETIRKAFEHLNKYIHEQQNSRKKWERNTLQSGAFNQRQMDLLNYAIKYPQANITVNEHRAHHNVSYPSARSDIKSLEKMGLLLSRKIGKEYLYQPCEDLSVRLGINK